MRPTELLKIKRDEILALAAKAGASNVRVGQFIGAKKIAQDQLGLVAQVTGAGLNNTSALCSFQCSAQVFLLPLATSSIS